FDDLAFLRWYEFADVVSLDWQFAMFLATIDQHCQLHPTRAAEIDQLIERRANRAAGIKHVVDQNDVAVFDVAGKVGAIDDRLGADGRKVVAIKSDVEHADWRSIT